MRVDLELCSLRSWRKDDAPALAQAGNNRNVWLKLRDRMPHPYSLRHAELYLSGAIGNESSGTYCIEVDGKMAGAIGLHAQEDVHRLTAELGYWLAEPYWGRGIASAAVTAMVDYGFATLPLQRIFASVYANNPASARVLEKAGFQFEGVMRRNVIKDGVLLDSLLYAKLRGEIAPRS